MSILSNVLLVKGKLNSFPGASMLLISIPSRWGPPDDPAPLRGRALVALVEENNLLLTTLADMVGVRRLNGVRIGQVTDLGIKV